MIPRFFIDRPIFAWVIAIIIVLGGLLALRQLPVASYPAVAPPALAINVTYPGASAKVIEETAIARSYASPGLLPPRRYSGVMPGKVLPRLIGKVEHIKIIDSHTRMPSTGWEKPANFFSSASLLLKVSSETSPGKRKVFLSSKVKFKLC